MGTEKHAAVALELPMAVATVLKHSVRHHAIEL